MRHIVTCQQCHSLGGAGGKCARLEVLQVPAPLQHRGHGWLKTTLLYDGLLPAASLAKHSRWPAARCCSGSSSAPQQWKGKQNRVWRAGYPNFQRNAEQRKCVLWRAALERRREGGKPSRVRHVSDSCPTASPGFGKASIRDISTTSASDRHTNAQRHARRSLDP